MNDRAGSNKLGRAAWCSVFATFAVACGGAPPPPPVVTTQAPPPPPVALAAVTDLAEVPEPSHVIGVLRWKSPKDTLDIIYQWVGVHLNPGDLASDPLEKKLAEMAATDAPVDLVVALDPKSNSLDKEPLAALSIGVRSLEEVRKAGLAAGVLTELRPGEYKLAPKKAKRDRSYCVLRAAVGVAPARVVCGRHERDIEALLPYMTRTLPKRDLGPSDVHVEFRMPPVLDMYGPTIQQGLRLGAAYGPRKLEIGEPTFDRAIARVATGLSDELGALAGDLDTVSLDVDLSQERAQVDVAMRFKAQQSWLTGTLANQGARMAPPPPMFWRLPASSTTAGFARTAEARRFESIRHTLAELVDGLLLHEGVSPADRAPLDALFSDKYAVDSPWVQAGGPFADDPKAVPGKPSAAPRDPVQAGLEKFGFYLVGVGTPNAVPDLLKNGVSALGRPKIQQFIKEKLAQLATLDDHVDTDDGASDEKPKAKLPPPSFSVKTAPLPTGLKAGSAAYEVTLTHDTLEEGEPTEKKASKPKPQHRVYKLQVLVVPEAAQTWIAIGANRVKLTAVVQSVLEGAPESGTLASRPDAAVFRDGKFAGASMMTLEGLLRISGATSKLGPQKSPLGGPLGKFDTALESTPHKGKTPIVMTSTISNEGALVATTHAEIPKGVIEDIIILAASSALSMAP